MGFFFSFCLLCFHTNFTSLASIDANQPLNVSTISVSSDDKNTGRLCAFMLDSFLGHALCSALYALHLSSREEDWQVASSSRWVRIEELELECYPD